MEITPEIREIEHRAAAADVPITDILNRAGVAATTWWRWTTGKYEPRLSMLRKVQAALESEIAGRQ